MLQILNQGSDKLESCICKEQPVAAERATLSVDEMQSMHRTWALLSHQVTRAMPKFTKI